MEKLNKTNVLTILTLLLIVAFVFLISYYFIFSKSRQLEKSPVNKTLSAVEGKQGFTDMEGKPLAFEDDFGKIIVVFAWASWCPGCAEDLQKMDEFAKEYQNENLKLIAVNRAENKFTAERFLASIPTLENLEIVLDPDDVFFNALEGYAMPETVVYGEEGEILLHQRGLINLDEIREVIPELE